MLTNFLFKNLLLSIWDMRILMKLLINKHLRNLENCVKRNKIKKRFKRFYEILKNCLANEKLNRSNSIICFAYFSIANISELLYNSLHLFYHGVMLDFINSWQSGHRKHFDFIFLLLDNIIFSDIASIERLF